MEPTQERYRGEGTRSYTDQTEQATQQRPTQEELRTNSQEFGGEANRMARLTEELAALARELRPALAQITQLVPNGNHPPPNPAPSDFGYHGIDTARDHRILGEALSRNELAMLEIKSVIMEFRPAILQLETRLETRFSRIEYQLNRIKQAA